MSFSRKLRKLIKHPISFFVDARLNKKNALIKNVDLNKNNTKPNVKIYNEVVNFANNYPVNSLRYNDEYVWPYVRHHLLVQLTAVSIGKLNYRMSNPFLLQLGNPEGIKFEKCKEFAEKYNFKFLEQIDENREGVDFLFFTALNASEQVYLEDKIYYRITDPVYEAAKKIGTALKIELIRNNSPAIHKVNDYFHKALHIFSPRIIKSGFSGFVSIGSDFNKYSKRFLPSLSFSDKEMMEIIDWEFHTRDFYLELLRKFKPSIIFVSSFHYSAPLISAAKTLGIKSVDLQHGIQVGYNPLYNSWNELPKNGYQSLPDMFFVWGQKEYNNIKKVFGSYNHKPIIAGNPYFWKLAEMESTLSQNLIKKLKERSINILLILQSQTEIPSLFKDIINFSSKDVMWFIRHHPKGKKFSIDDFTEDHSRVCMNDEVDTIPVIDLLKNMQATLSEGSTVALEGDALGVAAFIVSSTGYENYKMEIDQKKFYYVNSVESFNQIIADIDFNERSSRTNPFPQIDLTELLKNLLKNKV